MSNPYDAAPPGPVIDLPAAPAAIDTEIADHRAKYSEALNSRAHPEHSVRAAQLSALYERKFAGDLVSVPEKPDGQAVMGTPSPVPPASDVVGGDQPGNDLTDASITDVSKVDFSRLKAKEIPGAEVDETLERYAKEWVVAGELNQVEAEGLSLIYAAGLAANPVEVARIEQLAEEHMRHAYGPDMRAAATAALKVADEIHGLREFLDNNPAFAANPQVIDALVKAAKKRGYFKKGNAA